MFVRDIYCFFRENIVPDKLKSAVVYPICKGETKMLCSNYRPISISPIFSKTDA